MWYAATTGTGHNGRKSGHGVSQVVVAYHKLSRLVLMWWCGRRLTRAPVGSRSSGGEGEGDFMVEQACGASLHDPSKAVTVLRVGEIPIAVILDMTISRGDACGI